MWVTLYTDASWRHQEKRGGWGARAICNDGTSEASGPLDASEATTSTHAEMLAVVHGAKHVVKLWPHCVGLHVVTDCQAVIRALAFGRPLANAKHRKGKIQRAFQNAAGDRRYKFRWVKGHSNHDGARSWTNQRVDELSRSHY